jgi:outer membrane protein assembly factor BamB
MPGGSQSVTQRGGDPGKTQHYIRPMMTKAKAATLAVDAGFNATYSGTVTGTPLYLENGPGGKGAFYVATQSNNVYAFDETTGAQIWMKNAGGAGQGACDNQGKGIMSTPAIDVASRTLFAVSANPGLMFKVHAYDVDTGTEKAGGWPVDLNAVLNGTDLARSNQRGALLLVGGILYVPFGGQVGDCQNARGRVVAINIADPTKTGSWSTGDDGSAIWGSGGIASDGTGVFAITGNHFPNFSAPAAHSDSEEVVRLTGLAQLTRNNNNIFFPSRWSAMDSGDLDFGSNSPMVFDVPGATPARYVAAPAKDGHLYFLDATNLGGMGGEKIDMMVAQQGSSLFTAPAAYQTATKGTFVALNASGARCPPGQPTGRVIMGISIAVTAGAINPTVAWCASDATATSPAVTTTDGKSDAVVWFVSGGVLKGVDGETGTQVFSGGACPVERWTAVLAAKGARIVSAGGGKLCSLSAM